MPEARVLNESADRGGGPAGTLGFRDGDVWRHATTIVSEQRRGTGIAARLDTNDPLGRQIDVVLTPQRRGVIRLRASIVGPRDGITALGIGFDARRGERYLGFGERSNAVDQRGGEVENYVAEGAYQAEERPIIAAFVPPWAISRAPTRPTSRSRGCSPPPATGCWSTTPRRAISGSHRRLRCLEPRGARRRRLAARLRGARPGHVAAPLHGDDRAAARGRRAVVFRSLVPALRRRAGRGRELREPTPRSRSRRPTPTTCHARPGRPRGRERERSTGSTTQGLAVTTYFNPMICTTHPRYGEARPRAR